MTASALAITTDVIKDGKQVVGYGFNSNGRYAPTCLLNERFIPRLLEADPKDIVTDDGSNFDPHKIHKIIMANVLLLSVFWTWQCGMQLQKSRRNRCINCLLNAIRAGKWTKRYIYAAGGYYFPDKGLKELQDEMKGYLNLGYRDVKMKVGGASLKEDLQRIEAVLAILPKGSGLMVDANGRFDMDYAIEFGQAIKDYELIWYEEAGDPLDYQLQAELSKTYPHAMATGENLLSLQDATNLIRYGGMNPEQDFLQFDCALSYGLVEYLRILDMLKENGWSSRRCIPHGGHQMSLNIAAGLALHGNESYPGVFEPFGGFADNYAVKDGYVGMPDVPGIGFEAKANLYELLSGIGK